MGMVAPTQRIASAFAVVFGRYGEVTRSAQERGVCRQRLYRESAWVMATLAGSNWQPEMARLREQVRQLEQRNGELTRRLEQAVVLSAQSKAA